MKTETVAAPPATELEMERDGAVVRLTLNRPDRRNALSRSLVGRMEEALGELALDRSARVVVIAARGPVFCSGHDLAEMSGRTGDEYRDLFAACSRVMLGLRRLPQPVIARVHGIATAAGCQLVSMCDLAVASESAKFALPGVNIGVFCSTPVVGVARNIPRKQAMEMLLTGDLIDAHTAAARGLVNRVVPDHQLDAEIEKLTDAIVARSGAVIGAGKRAFYQQLDLSLADAYLLAGEAMACNLMMEDASEGVDAFLDKRAPLWRDR